MRNYSVQEANNLTLGQLGFTIIAEGAAEATTGPFIAVKAFNGNVFVTTTTDVGDALTAAELSSGDIVYGAFKTVAYPDGAGTGTLIAYRG